MGEGPENIGENRPELVDGLESQGNEAQQAHADAVAKDASKTPENGKEGTLGVDPVTTEVATEVATETPVSKDETPQTDSEVATETPITGAEAGTVTPESAVETPKTEYEILVDEAGGPNKYTKMLSDVAEQTPQIAEHPLFKALIILAAKYGGLFDALSNIGVSFDERINKEEYNNEKLESDDAQKLLALQTISTAISEDSINFNRNPNEQTESSSTRFAAGVLFGSTDGTTLTLADREITDPYQLAAKLDKGHFDASSNNTKAYEKVTNPDVFFANMNSFSAGSVVFFNVEEPKTEEKDKKENKLPFTIKPMLSGVLDGNGNILYFGPSKDDKTPKIRRIAIVDMKDKAFKIEMVMKKDPGALKNIVSGNTAPAVTPAVDQVAPAPAAAPAPAPGTAPAAAVAPAPAPAPTPAPGSATGTSTNPTNSPTPGATPAPATADTPQQATTAI